MLAAVVVAALVSRADPDGSPDAMQPLAPTDDVCDLIADSLDDEGVTCRRVARRRVADVGDVAVYRARDARYEATRYVIVVTDSDGARRASMPLDVGLDTKLCAGAEEPLRQHLRLRRVVVDGVASVVLDVRFAVRSNVVDGAYCKARGHEIWHDEVFLACSANGECLELAPGYFSYCPAHLARDGTARTCDGRRTLRWNAT